MLTWIFVVIVLYVVQIYLVSILRFTESGLSDQEMITVGLGTRDDTPGLSVRGERAERALNNLKESLPIFLTLAVLSIVMDKQTALAVYSAIVFAFARVIYVPLYVKGIPFLRSGVWVVSFGALISMAVALI